MCGVVVRVARREILSFRDEGGEERDQRGSRGWTGLPCGTHSHVISPRLVMIYNHLTGQSNVASCKYGIPRMPLSDQLGK